MRFFFLASRVKTERALFKKINPFQRLRPYHHRMDMHLDVLNQLTERVRAAGTRGSALRIRGGGTKDFYGHTPNGELLDMTATRAWSATSPASWW